VWIYTSHCRQGRRWILLTDEVEGWSCPQSYVLADSKSYDNDNCNANTYRHSYGNSDTYGNSDDYGHTYADSVSRGDRVYHAVNYAHSFTYPFNQLFTDSHIASDT
jgi:hypothetical protein